MVRRAAAGKDALLQAEDILHVVESGRLLFEPESGPHRAGGEGQPRGRLVGEFDPLAIGGEDHRVIADDITAAATGLG